MASIEKSAGRSESGEFKAFPGHLRMKDHQKEAILHAARLFGSGYHRVAVAKAIYREYFPGRTDSPELLTKMVRNVLRKYEKQQWFRDLVWDEALVELDMAGPAILRGVAGKAKRGRVDAAKLALGITGRYVDKANETPSAVTINLVGIPRPEQAVGAEALEQAVEAGEVIDED